MNLIQPFILTIFGLTFFQCSPDKKTSVTNKKESFKSELIIPDSSSGDFNFYSLFNTTLKIPSIYNCTRSHGPDFSVYSIGYPLGSRIGIYTGTYPSVPACISVYTDRKFYGAGIREPILQRISSNQIHKTNCQIDVPRTDIRIEEMGYKLKKYDWFQTPPNYSRKFYIADTLTMEVFQIDSVIYWMTKPRKNKFGSVDILLDDLRDNFNRIHVFAKTNQYLNDTLVLELALMIGQNK